MNAYAYHRRNRVRLLGTPRASTNPTVREPVIEIERASGAMSIVPVADLVPDGEAARAILAVAP